METGEAAVDADRDADDVDVDPAAVKLVVGILAAHSKRQELAAELFRFGLERLALMLAKLDAHEYREDVSHGKPHSKTRGVVPTTTILKLLCERFSSIEALIAHARAQLAREHPSEHCEDTVRAAAGSPTDKLTEPLTPPPADGRHGRDQKGNRDSCVPQYHA